MVRRACFGGSIRPFSAWQRRYRKLPLWRQPTSVLDLENLPEKSAFPAYIPVLQEIPHSLAVIRIHLTARHDRQEKLSRDCNHLASHTAEQRLLRLLAQVTVFQAGFAA